MYKAPWICTFSKFGLKYGGLYLKLITEIAIFSFHCFSQKTKFALASYFYKHALHQQAMLTEQFLASNFYPVPFISSFGQLRVNVQIPFNQSASFIVLSAYDGNLINCLNSIFHQFVMTGATLLPRDTIILLKIIGERHSFESLRPICFKVSCSAIKHLNKKMNTLINYLVLESRTPSSRDT